MRYSVVVGLLITGAIDPIEGALDEVMDELVKLGTIDPAVSAELDNAQVEVSLAVDADTLTEAITAGLGTVRTALHAAEVQTPVWPVFADRLSVVAELVDA